MGKLATVSSSVSIGEVAQGFRMLDVALQTSREYVEELQVP